MKKALHFVFVVLFVGICSLPLLGLVFGYENVNIEKRALAPAPVFINEQGFNPSYPQEAEDYLSDHYAFKPYLVTADAIMRGALFGESVSEKVIIGREGWLYFAPTLPDHLATDVLSDNEVYRIARTLMIQKEALARKDIDFVFVVAPNKASLYPECMADRYVPTGKENNYDRLYAKFAFADIGSPDLRSLLRTSKLDAGSDETLYLKLDSHWNGRGAMIAYRAITNEIRSRRPDLVLNDYRDVAVEKQEIINGDLSVMLYPAAELIENQYVYALPADYTSARPIRSMEDMLIQTSCAGGQGNLLMFRDSFANALIPFFSDAFSSATYSRAVPYDYRLMTEQTDVVVLEIVERNLANLITAAPILSSYAIEPITGAQPDDIDLTVYVENVDGVFRLYGTAVPSNYDPATNYDIFIRLDGERSYTYVTFPILEPELAEEEEGDQAQNAAFSARIDLSALDPGTYSVSIVVRDKNGSVIAPYGEIAAP
ncbi:MAG: hypothetical protein JW817_01345 [Clostridiales bacterium]|nr:hypothetical protein [Clostridiales bacterium]